MTTQSQQENFNNQVLRYLKKNEEELKEVKELCFTRGDQVIVAKKLRINGENYFDSFTFFCEERLIDISK